MKQGSLVGVLFLGLCMLVSSGCASTHFAKMSQDFKDRKIDIRTIGFLAPLEYMSNRDDDGKVLENAIIESLRNKSIYQLKLVRKADYPEQWNSDVERIISNSREYLRDIELKGLWKDKKNTIISRKFSEEIKQLQSLDPEIDALLLVKCKQHYGNPWAGGLYAFGLLGGLVAAAGADDDPVIGKHSPADNDVYSSAVLVDLKTADILWYNFALRYGLNVTKAKDADNMAKDILSELVNK